MLEGHASTLTQEKTMTRPVQILCIIAATWLATPAAMAGTDVLKCTDPQGHVTLTDQPCESGATATRLVQDAGGTTTTAPLADTASGSAPRRHTLPVTDVSRPQRQAMDRPAPLSRDIATLKEARRALLLMDTRPTLAGLQ
jgi:hypothetical protein